MRCRGNPCGRPLRLRVLCKGEQCSLLRKKITRLTEKKPPRIQCDSFVFLLRSKVGKYISYNCPGDCENNKYNRHNGLKLLIFDKIQPYNYGQHTKEKHIRSESVIKLKLHQLYNHSCQTAAGTVKVGYEMKRAWNTHARSHYKY